MRAQLVDPIAIALFGLAGLLATGAIVVAVRRARREDAPGGVPTIAEGKVVTITGTVRVLGEPLVAPLSARSCVLYEAYANVYETSSGAHRSLSAQIFDRKMQPFELETSIGSVLVDGIDAELDLLPRPVFPRVIEREVVFLRHHGREAATVHTTSFEETTIDPGALIAVRGRVRIADDARISLTHDGDQPLRIGPPGRTVVG